MLWLLDIVFFLKQRTSYEMRISDWSSDVCSSDLPYLAEMPSPKSLFHFGKLADKFGADKLRRYPRGTRLTMGNALAARLLASALAAGVTPPNGGSAEHPLVAGKRACALKAGGDELRAAVAGVQASGRFSAHYT